MVSGGFRWFFIVFRWIPVDSGEFRWFPVNSRTAEAEGAGGVMFCYAPQSH